MSPETAVEDAAEVRVAPRRPRAVAAVEQTTAVATLGELPEHPTLADLPTHDARVSLSDIGEAVTLAFEERPELPGMVVEGGGAPVALVSRHAYFREMSRKYSAEIYARRPLSVLLEMIDAPLLVLDASVDVGEACARALDRPGESAFEPVLVAFEGKASRVLDAHVLMLAQTRLLDRARKREEHLRQAGKMEAIGQLAGGVAHDFNNLLTVILASVDLLALELGEGTETTSRLIADATKAAQRAAGLTGQLLGFARQKSWVTRPLDFNDCVAETMRLLQRVIDPRIVMEVRAESPLWRVAADATQVNHVLMNLCVNARDAMPEGGRLTIETANCPLGTADVGEQAERFPGEFVRVRVVDTGTGIPPEILPRIFEPFFTTKGPGRGTGLGLAMAYAAVKQIGGWIECASVVGRGTTFTLYLPRSRDAAVAAPAAVPAGPFALAKMRPTDGPALRILVVDDEEMIRNIASMMLRQCGYEVLVAEDGVAAIETYRRESGRFDLVLLDVTMPRLSGIDVFRRLRALDPHAAVLFSSGYSALRLSESDLEGSLGFVSKPYQVEELVRAVAGALATRLARARAPSGS